MIPRIPIEVLEKAVSQAMLQGSALVRFTYLDGEVITRCVTEDICYEPQGNCERCGALHYLGHAHICNTERSNREIMHGD
jgi:hypothetical protein